MKTCIINNELYEYNLIKGSGQNLEWGAYDIQACTDFFDIMECNGKELSDKIIENPSSLIPFNNSNTTIWYELKEFRESNGNDWFIPSIREIVEIMYNSDIQELKRKFIWSSTEENTLFEDSLYLQNSFYWCSYRTQYFTYSKFNKEEFIDKKFKKIAGCTGQYNKSLEGSLLSCVMAHTLFIKKIK